jgi:hypothetical protein
MHYNASSWFLLCEYITMHGQQNIKFINEYCKFATQVFRLCALVIFFVINFFI